MANINSIPRQGKQSPPNSKTERRFLFFYWTILYFLVFLALFSEASSKLDPDLGWHLRIGQEILLERQVPRIEQVTYPTLGESWVDHEWLANLSMYLVYSSGGAYGNWLMSFAFSLFLLATFHLSIKGAQKYLLASLPPLQSTLLVSLAFFASFHSVLIFFGNRIQVVSWFLLALALYLFAKIYAEKRYRLLLVFPPLFVLWANLHGSFVFGLGILSGFCLLLFLQKKTRNQKFLIGGTFAASFFATLLTPYHFELWGLLAGEYATESLYLSHILEWLPIYASPHILWAPSLLISFFIAALLISGPKRILTKKGLLLYLAFCAATMLLAIKARRFIPFFALSSIPLSAFFLKEIFQNFVPGRKFLSFLLVVFGVILLSLHFRAYPLPKDIFSSQGYFSPGKAVSFIKSDPVLRELKIFNNYDWGGYLTWVWQEKKIFIDGRMPQRPLQKNLSFLGEYLNFHQRETIGAKLREYGIQLALVRNNKPFAFGSAIEKFLYEKIFFLKEEDFAQKKFLVEYLEQNWEKIYEDEVSFVYILPDAKEERSFDKEKLFNQSEE